MSTVEQVRKAAEVLTGVARRTPLLTSPFLDEIAGRRVFLKAECLQHTGSFKFRGAWFALSQIPAEQRARGVIAFSSGNHAQGVANAARAAGVPSVIIMPADAPALKIANTRALGAEVVLYDRETEDRDEIGARLAAERSLTLIKPFDDPNVIAGQGTVGLELREQAAEAGIESADVLVCCGGGGLTSGIALGLDGTDLTVRPVEPEGFDDVSRSLRSGGIERNNRMSGSLCDAIITPQPGDITFPILKAHCGAGLVISDEEALRAIALAFQRLKVVIEPGGAVALAAALFRADQIEGDAVICVATGGNVDAAVFARALDTLDA
ncbi:threonine ammonia-lyase [Pontivivens insulae]|uniref:L-threonine dehydratase catabolic TdcB n=1 Tax=Pontivivens insulae TaxID=1639689 RepID=A0A2R8AE57_9RHOB|nr:threonine/serine dehydratase [Pontivivens insulae]RED11794.1 threonine dehydratase [Pontivivens insulae]SPF30551.1 L-threonine dehydratase catabolic TdcB [Pontivivens insulae]